MKLNRRYAKCNCIKEIKALNTAQGYKFFSRETLQFFDSVIEDDVFGGCVFITSEQNGYGNPRLYTVRAIQANGRIETLSDFQGIETLKQALAEARTMASKLSQG
tara:strand:+ start:1004 stop:1318 length:315 start_codon:yes stop_codon:yes gene_type:complete